MAWRNGVKFPVSARVRAARGYASKDACERGVVLRGNEVRDGRPGLAHPGRRPVRQAAACGPAGDARAAGLVGRVFSYRGCYPECCHPYGCRTTDPNVLALAAPGSPDPNVLAATRTSSQFAVNPVCPSVEKEFNDGNA
jgi:hypothetical protein